MSRIVIVILIYHRHKPIDLNESMSVSVFFKVRVNDNHKWVVTFRINRQ
jgi:hypothetical protein